MATKEERYAEAYRRGILPADKKARYEEAVRRGLMKNPELKARLTGLATDTQAPTASHGFMGDLAEEITNLPKAALLGLVGTRDMANWEHPLNYLSPWGSAHDVSKEDIYRAKGTQQAGDIATSLAAWMTGEGLVEAGLKQIAPDIASLGGMSATGSRLLKTAGGSLASQTAEGSPSVETTGKDLAIAEGLSLALGAPGRAMNAVKNFMGRPDADMLRTAEHIGISPSLSLASGGRGAQVMESALTKTPGGAGVMESHGNKLLDDIGRYIERMIQKSGGRAGDSSELGGNIRNALNSFIKQFGKEGEKKYDKFWQLLPKNTRMELKDTRDTLNTILNRYVDDPAIQKLLDNQKLTAIKDAIESSKDGMISANTARALRTDIGLALNKEGPLAEDTLRGDMKNLYGALTRDINKAASRASPQAQAALRDADNFWFEGRRRIDNYLDPLAKKDDGDAVFKALFGEASAGGMKGLGPIRAKEILGALPANVRGEVVSEVIDRMGRSSAGKQGAKGGEFSMSTYLTNWNKMNQKTKEVLFSDPSIRKDMDELANFAEKYKARTKLMNTSNTAPASDFYEKLSKIGGAGAGWLTGGPFGALVGSILAPVVTSGVAHVTAKMMTSPEFIKWMARVSRTKGPEEVGRLIGRLITIHDNQPELRDDLENYVNDQ
ncbi:TPA: hypothetical protein ACNIQM_002092 [Citrobacter werkmanii]